MVYPAAPAPAAFRRVGELPLLMLISDDERLSRSREPLLHAAGFEVVTVSSAQFNVSRLPDGAVVIFFCQTVSTELACELMDLLQRSAKRFYTVRLTRGTHKEQAKFDVTLQSPIAPDLLTREAIKLRIAITGEKNRD